MSIHEQARAEAEKRWPTPDHRASQEEYDYAIASQGAFEDGAEWAATRMRVVTTVTELDALPVGSVVLTEEGWLAKKFNTTLTQHWDVTETWRRGNYPDVRLVEHGPLTVLYDPED